MSANLPEIARGGWRNCETPWLVDRVEAVEASLDTTRGIKEKRVSITAAHVNGS